MPIRRPPTLEDWRLEQGWSYARLGQELDVTGAAARRYCLPKDHPDFRYPRDPEVRRKIAEMTGGRVIFY